MRRAGESTDRNDALQISQDSQDSGRSSFTAAAGSHESSVTDKFLG